MRHWAEMGEMGQNAYKCYAFKKAAQKYLLTL